MINESKLKGDVKSAGRALDIIELLVRFPAGLNLTDIGEHLDIPLSSLHNLMQTLAGRGYLTKDEQFSVYKVSSKLIQLAAIYHSQHDLVSIADPVMEQVSRATEETTSLAVLQDSAVVFVHKRAAQSFLQVVNPAGTRVLAHATGLGKAMLAHLSREAFDSIYPQPALQTLTKNTLATRSALAEALVEVRRLGYAVDDEESSIGVWAVAAAILNRGGRPIAALSVAAPLSRVDQQRKEAWCGIVRDGAQEISRALSFLT